MTVLESWLHFVLIAACVIAAIFIWNTKWRRFEKVLAFLMLITFAILLFLEVVFVIWQFQMNRGF